MRNVNAHLLEDKMDEVTHYINSHQPGEPVHVDGSPMSLNVQDENGRVVTVLQGQGFPTQINRQVTVGEQVEGGPWNEELLDPEMRLAALVAHLAHQSRASHNQTSSHSHPKISSVRGDVDSSVILDASLKLFSSQHLDSQSEPIVVEVPTLPPMPPLTGICQRKNQETDWYHNKDKTSLKEDSEILHESESMMELTSGASPAQLKQQNKKSLPHKKRISRKLKRNIGSSTPQQDIVVLNCSEGVPQEEILPDNFVTAVQHQEHLNEETHHIAHEVRAILICQLCGEFYGEEQLKFYQHLKQHYEPQATIIIENPVPDLAIDKMTNTCIVDNGATLPDAIVELSLENTVPKTMYQPIDKHILYTSSDKTMYTNRVQYSMASMDKEPVVPTSEAEKTDIYDTFDKFEMYSCVKCNKQFRKQKQCEAHIKEAHSSSKIEDMGEFSDPEDLMEGIHVAVEEGSEQYEQNLIPHLTVENGQVHQEHVRHWYMRNGAGGTGSLAACGVEGAYCPVCPPPPRTPLEEPQNHLKEEVLQRIFESEVPNDQPDHFPDNIIQEEVIPAEPEPPPEEIKPEHSENKKKSKKCECPQCGRVFFHRNSLLYHILSHRGKQHECRECGKGFYTPNALKVHVRVHNGDRPYKCEDCGREFRQWSDLKYHKVSLHSNQKHFKCDYCGKEFARKYSLNVHRRIHTGEKNYKCDYCNKTFRASSYRLAHMRTHTGDRPYKCPTCEKGFRVAGDLRRHMLTHERSRIRPDDSKKQKDEKPKRNPPKIEPKLELKETKQPEQNPPKLKKIAVASTARPPLPKTVDKKQKLKKAPIKKGGGAPNVTVVQSLREQFKINTEYSNVEPFDSRQEYGKFKEVYTDSHPQYAKEYKGKDYAEQIYSYKDSDQERDLAVLKPMYKSSLSVETHKPVYSRSENTDGKMQVFTHVEKAVSLVPSSLSDLRSVDRERADLHGENIETGFLENLTALYNIPAV